MYWGVGCRVWSPLPPPPPHPLKKANMEQCKKKEGKNKVKKSIIMWLISGSKLTSFHGDNLPYVNFS